MTSQKINASILNDITKDLDKKKIVEVCNGKYKVEMFENFRETTMNDIISLFVSLINKLSTNKDKTKKSKADQMKITSDIISLQPACILFKLTDLYFPDPNTSPENLEKFLKAYKTYLDMGIVKEIMDEINEENMEKLKLKLESFVKNFKGLSDKLIKEEIKNDVK